MLKTHAAQMKLKLALNIVPPMDTGLPAERVGRCFWQCYGRVFYLSVPKDMGCRRQNDKGVKKINGPDCAR